jgi:hypothetical protein
MGIVYMYRYVLGNKTFKIFLLIYRGFNIFQVHQYFLINIWTIFMNILYNTLNKEVPKIILGG